MMDGIDTTHEEKAGNRELSRVGSTALTMHGPHQPPTLIADAGPAALTAWDDFFVATIRNRHTRAAYGSALRSFFDWMTPHAVPVERITPGMIGHYFDEHPGSIPTRKLHLAALRAFFDRLVIRHICLLNPAASVRGERYRAIEGKTPEISIEQARKLLSSIPVERENEKGEPVRLAVGLRDRAIIAVLIYTSARAGAVAKLRVRDFIHDGTQWSLRFEEKGGKFREIPVRHDLQQFILAYIDASNAGGDPQDTPLFRSAERRTGRLTHRSMSGIDICRLIKRRLRDACLPLHFSPHSFRVTTITDLLTQGVPLEDVQYLAGHADPRTTRLYDRRQKRVTRNVVERISI